MALSSNAPQPDRPCTPWSTPSSTPLWSEWALTLRDVIRRLRHREFVVLSDRSRPSRYVQALRTGQVLTVECAGAREDNGPAALRTQTQAALLDLGWPPIDRDEGFPNYRDRWLTNAALTQPWGIAGATQVAQRMVATLRLLGVDGPDHLQVERFTKPDPEGESIPDHDTVEGVRAWIAERDPARLPPASQPVNRDPQ